MAGQHIKWKVNPLDLKGLPQWGLPPRSPQTHPEQNFESSTDEQTADLGMDASAKFIAPEEFVTLTGPILPVVSLPTVENRHTNLRYGN